MKKYMLTLILGIILSNCEIRVKESHAQLNRNSSENLLFNHDRMNGVYFKRVTINGMEYGILYEFYNYRHAAMNTVNLTKDSLEIELIKKQLNKYK